MDDKERHSAFMSALVTEHYVPQAAASATVSEAAARASLYVYSLSSCLVAMGFASRSSEVFRPFAAAVLPAVFILGIFTIARLVDTGIEYQQALRGASLRFAATTARSRPRPPPTSPPRTVAGRRSARRRGSGPAPSSRY
jgi:hypothetical protein